MLEIKFTKHQELEVGAAEAKFISNLKKMGAGHSCFTSRISLSLDFWNHPIRAPFIIN